MSGMVVKALMAGYNRRCAGYVILLRDNLAVIQFLQTGHHLRIVNTRARYHHSLACNLSLYVDLHLLFPSEIPLTGRGNVGIFRFDFPGF